MAHPPCRLECNTGEASQEDGNAGLDFAAAHLTDFAKNHKDFKFIFQTLMQVIKCQMKKVKD